MNAQADKMLRYEDKQCLFVTECLWGKQIPGLNNVCCNLSSILSSTIRIRKRPNKKKIFCSKGTMEMTKKTFATIFRRTRMRTKRWVFRSKIILFEWEQHYFEFIQLSLVVDEMIITAEKSHWYSETEKKEKKSINAKLAPVFLYYSLFGRQCDCKKWQKIRKHLVRSSQSSR